MGCLTELLGHKSPPVIWQNGKIRLRCWPRDMFFKHHRVCLRVQNAHVCPFPNTHTLVQTGFSVFGDVGLQRHVRLGTVTTCRPLARWHLSLPVCSAVGESFEQGVQLAWIYCWCENPLQNDGRYELWPRCYALSSKIRDVLKSRQPLLTAPNQRASGAFCTWLTSLQ